MAATASSKPTRRSCSCTPKCIPGAYAAPTLLRMCGICGIASTNGSAVTDPVAAMSATLIHRGPDSFGAFSDGDVAPPARRPSILDPETGDQPIANEDGTPHVAPNGQIYNYRELRRELERAGG